MDRYKTKIDRLKAPQKAVCKTIGEYPNCNSVLIEEKTGIPANIVRTIVSSIRDEGIPIQTKGKGYVIDPEGYIDNLKKQITSKIRPTVNSYNKKVSAFSGDSNMSITELGDIL